MDPASYEDLPSVADWMVANLRTIVIISGLTGFCGSLVYRLWRGKMTGWSFTRIVALLAVSWFLSVKIALVGWVMAAMITGMILRYRKRKSGDQSDPAAVADASSAQHSSVSER